VIESTCVECGDREEVVPGVTLISVNGQVEQRCIREWQESRPQHTPWGLTWSQRTRVREER
jgi:hypothetical protein